MKRLILCLASSMALFAFQARAAVTLTQEGKDINACYRLDNGRVALVVDPSQGGSVSSYKDKLGGNVELIDDTLEHGLCRDHLQSQGWPGELYNAQYEVIERKNEPQACRLALRYQVTGQWRDKEDEKIKDLVLEKTYILRADSPALECRIKFTAPRQGAKSFAYWQQHILLAGGQCEYANDRSFRPSKRGIKVVGADYDKEPLIHDPAAGWMALLDTKSQSGLVVLSDYQELKTLYVCSNYTLEPMYRPANLAAGQSVEYTTYIVPVVGLNNVVSATPDYIAGYSLKTNGPGAGTLSLSVIRSVRAPAALSMNVSLASTNKPASVAANAFSFATLADRVQTKNWAFTNAGAAPFALNIETESKAPTGTVATGSFTEYFDPKSAPDAVFLPEPPDFVPGSWTLVLFPDSQRYCCEHQPGIFTCQTHWIAKNKEKYNIRYVLHVGDITGLNTDREWRYAQEAMNELDGQVPYALVTGNHDNIQYRDIVAGKSSLNRYFPASKFKNWPTFGGAMDGDSANSYHLFSAGGTDWIVIALEWAPRHKTVQWANEVLAKYPDRKAMLVTHAYLYSDNTRYDYAKKGKTQEWAPRDLSPDRKGDLNDGEELWQKLVRKNNFALTFNGHVGGPCVGVVAARNDQGKAVYSMWTDYGPMEGYLRILEFLPDGKTVHVKTYSPLLDTYLQDAGNQFNFELDP